MSRDILKRVLMIRLCFDTHTSSTSVAVEEVFTASSLAGATHLAVENLFAQIVIEQIANVAKVFAECDLAFLTCFLGRLYRCAKVTLDLFDISSVENMV